MTTPTSNTQLDSPILVCQFSHTDNSPKFTTSQCDLWEVLHRMGAGVFHFTTMSSKEYGELSVTKESAALFGAGDHP